MLCFPLSHPRQRLRHRRAHGPAANTHSFRNFLLRKAEVVVGDDNRSLPFGKQREEPTHFESLENGGGRVVRGDLAQRTLAEGAKQASSGLAKGCSIKPTLHIAIVRWRMSQSLLEGIVQAIERTLAIERRRDNRAIDLWERPVVELLPSLDGEFGHARSNAISRLDRLVASPDSTGRQRGRAGVSVSARRYGGSIHPKEISAGRCLNESSRRIYPAELAA